MPTTHDEPRAAPPSKFAARVGLAAIAVIFVVCFAILMIGSHA